MLQYSVNKTKFKVNIYRVVMASMPIFISTKTIDKIHDYSARILLLKPWNLFTLTDFL